MDLVFGRTFRFESGREKHLATVRTRNMCQTGKHQNDIKRILKV